VAHSPKSPISRSVKRAVDIVGSATALALLAPLLLVIATAIRLTSRGPVLFAQERTGRNGKPFRLYKFRTMTGPPAVEVGRETQTDDPRITAVGRWLRRMGCDELPQLVNVLRGEMSLVGPRPLLAWENALCEGQEAHRLHVLPGITGLAQVNGRNAIPWCERIMWDVTYVEQESLALDLSILLRTIPVVVFGRHAYAAGPEEARPAPRRGIIEAGSECA
jgi:lipopolysaccharide/colanic/teichoic acid biosynthesis glycosyltransferase